MNMVEKKKYYPDADQNLNFAKMEEKILDFWNKNKIFEELEKMVKNLYFMMVLHLLVDCHTMDICLRDI